MLGIIGGTGLYGLDGLETVNDHRIDTPFGQPSAAIREARYGSHTLFFLPRHGLHHEFLPHEINYRANIHALKSLGVRRILGVSAVGSLREELAPGQFVIPSQYIDLVRGPRDKTFLGKGLSAHISTAEPVCPILTQWVVQAAHEMNLPIHIMKAYACVDGPRLGTRAESFMLRTIGADLVGTTNVPEVFLAREAQIDYAALCIVTDYDCWRDDPADHVSVSAIFERFGASLSQAKALLARLLDGPMPPADEARRQALKGSLMVHPESLTPEVRALYALLSQ